MANVTPSLVRVTPSFVMPEILLQYQQASGAFDLLAGGNVQTRLGEGDLAVYVNKADVRTKVAASQATYNQLPSATIVFSQMQTATYNIRTRAEYDHHDTAAFARFGTSIVEGQRLAMRQGIFQEMRNALLYGMNPANGEGMLNTVGATTISLPSDSNGNTTVSTYDNGQLALFLLGQVSALKSRTMQLGIDSRISIVTTQRVLGALSYQGIVQLVQFQRPGAGSESIKGMVGQVLKMNGDIITWGADDTLIGKGAGGTDAIIITMPEVKKPTGGVINTNEFARLTPGLSACNLMLCDMAAPREITAPLPGGAVDVLSELRVTSGWTPRPEALTIVSAGY